MKRTYVVIGLAVIAAVAIATPSAGISLSKLIRKEVAKQISKATGPAGQAGTPGGTGAPGSPGVAGPGFNFTHSTGNPGPVLAQGGTYFAVVRVAISDASKTGACRVSDSVHGDLLAGGAFVTGSSGGFAFLSGMADLLADSHLQVSCFDTTETAVTITSVDWWISRVGP